MGRRGDGKSVQFAAPTGGVVSGRFYFVNGFVGMAFVTEAAGQLVAFDIDANGFYIVESADTIAVGDRVYFDTANNSFTDTTSDSAVFMGVCTRASDADGFFGFTKTPHEIAVV